MNFQNKIIIRKMMVLAIVGIQSSNAQWEKVSPVAGGQLRTLYSFTDAGGNITFLAGTDSGIYRSTDCGEHWNISNDGVVNDSINCFLYYGSTVFVGTDKGLFRSSDNGQHWTTGGSGFLSVPIVSITNGIAFYAATRSSVYQSFDGNSWSIYGTSLPSNITISSICVVASPIAGTTTDGLYRYSLNSWSRASNSVAGISIRTMTPFGRNYFAGAQSEGVYISAGSGIVWTQVDTGLTDLHIHALTGDAPFLASNTQGSVAFAATDSGVFRSVDRGSHWESFNEGLEGITMDFLTTSSPSNTIGKRYVVAGTDSGSIFRLLLNKPGATLVASTSIQFGNIFPGVPKSISIVLGNNGSDSTLTITGITSLNPAFTVNKTSLTIPPVSFDSMLVTFSPVSEGVSYMDSITFSTNDVSMPDARIYLYGTSIIYPPTLLSPSNGGIDVPTDALLLWKQAENGDSYRCQVSNNGSFSNIVFDSTGISGSFVAVHGLAGFTTYYWRVKTVTSQTEGSWSAAYSFTTGLATPVLVSPSNGATGVSINPTMIWNPSPQAETYYLHISADSNDVTHVLDSAFLSVTSFPLHNLDHGKTYYWSVGARSGSYNDPHFSAMSPSWHFTTIPLTAVPRENELPQQYELFQNYPNPFNPSTTIRYALPFHSIVHIEVYDVLGKCVDVLVHDEENAGYHQVTWKPVLPSGIYFCRFDAVSLDDRAQSFSSVHKVLLMK